MPEAEINPAAQPTNKRFPKHHRLLKHADFERVYKQGRRHFAQHMTVFHLGRDDQDGLRVGFTVSKAMGGAVQRNRMKRRLREAVRINGVARKIAADVVINPKRSLLAAGFSDLQAEIGKAFEVIERSLARTTRQP
jgi:ribonuclease P protein component